MAILRRCVGETLGMKALDEQPEPIVVSGRILLRVGRELELLLGLGRASQPGLDAAEVGMAGGREPRVDRPAVGGYGIV